MGEEGESLVTFGFCTSKVVVAEAQAHIPFDLDKRWKRRGCFAVSLH